MMLLLLTSMTAKAQVFETATDAVKNMRVGWNLGNTLDSNSGDVNNMWIEAEKNRNVYTYEKAWGQPVTKPELFKMLKDAGFNAVRVPVTWYPHMEATFNSVYGYSSGGKWLYKPWNPDTDPIGTKIQAAWMKRVHEVVDYVISQGMYCILNVHHDTGSANTAWLIADDDVYAQQQSRFEAVWKQIAEEFKDYDEHLLFEGYNEMLDSKRSWCFASFAANNKYDAAIAKSAYSAINKYAQSFVNAVRATGGNNSQRNLVVCTYGACDGSGNWNIHLQDPLKEMKLPADQIENHLIFEVHSYPDIKNLASVKNETTTKISNWKKYLIEKGAPLIVGEWGTNTENGYDNYRQNYLDFAKDFIEQTKASNIATFHWMGLSDGSARTEPRFNQQDLADAIIKGYYGENGYSTGIHSITEAISQNVDVYTLSGTLVGKGIPRSEVSSKLKKGIYIINKKKVVIP